MTVTELLEALQTAEDMGRGGTPVLTWATPERGWLTPSKVVGDEDRTIIELSPFT